MTWCGSKTAMGGSKTRIPWPWWPAAVAVAIAGGGILACAPRAQPRSLPPQAVTEQAPDPPPPSELPVAAPVVEDGKTVVIDPGGQQGAGEVSLAEAARAEKVRRQNAGPLIAVINNKNLPEHATGSLSSGSAPQLSSEATATLDAQAEQESYWRRRVRESRQKWHDAELEIVLRQTEIADLRQKFYAEDDPFRRDEQIKPAWDFALERLAAAKRASTESRTLVDAVLEEGRRAGALPGWLREGMELEPEPLQPRADTLEPGEPRVLDESDPP